MSLSRARSRVPCALGLFPRLALLAVLAPISLPACGFPMSPADLARNENHAYPGRTQAQVFHATLTALKTQGYQIVVGEQGTGLIKTAPKVMMATAYGNSYSAVATENAVGWTIGVTAISGGVGLHADPRGYSGGQAVPPEQMNGDYLERLFNTLYGEIDSNLPPPPTR
jgi:hypothetical protein